MAEMEKFVFINNKLTDKIKIIKMTYPLDESTECQRLNPGERAILKFNMNFENKVHIYSKRQLITKIDDLRFFKKGREIYILP